MKNLIGERIKLLREEKKLSQDDLGKIISISRLSVGNYERGDRKPDSDIIDKLCDYFDVSSDYLLGRSNIRKNNFEYQDDKMKLLSPGKMRALNSLILSIIDTIVRYENTDIRLSNSMPGFIIPHLNRQLVAFNNLLDNVEKVYKDINNFNFNENELSDFYNLRLKLKEKTYEICNTFEKQSKFVEIDGAPTLNLNLVIDDSLDYPMLKKYFDKTGKIPNK